jgi:hypothetical protein
MEAWELLTDAEQDDCWAAVDSSLAFQPSLGGRGIIEPAESVTFSLAPIVNAGEAASAAGENAVNAAVIRGLIEAFPEDEVLLALDWQHDCYRFRPHHSMEWTINSQTMFSIAPFPDGDYYFLMRPDMSAGTFGHPWAESLCIIGRPLVQVVAPTLESWLPVLRRGGKPT